MAKKILLVEDDPFIVDIYLGRLQKEGFLVDIANDGHMALEKIKNNPPDLLVLDIMLPQIDGWEILKILRSDERTKNINVIVISNINQQDYAGDSAKFGVLKYFLKIETTPDELVGAIKEILK